VLTGGFVGLHKEELDRADLDRQLAGLGAEGWELCWALMDQTLQVENDGHVLIFKRLVEREIEDPAEEDPAEEELVDQGLADEELAEEPEEQEPAEEEPRPPKNLPRKVAPNRVPRKSAPTNRSHGCVECGKPLREGARFCGACGAWVDA
jgi:zinc-ribbon domain